MKIDLEEYYESFMQEVWGSADSDRNFSESSFVNIFTDYLMDAGEFDSFDHTPFRSSIARGIQLDGYAGDPIDTEGVLSLVIADFNQDQIMGSLTKTELERIFRKLERFFEYSLKDDFYIKLEESGVGYGVAQMIHERKGLIRRVRLILLTNRNLSERVQGMAEGQIDSYPTTYSVWDISRLHRMLISGKGKEDLDIDLINDFGTTIPCLPAYLNDAKYEAYLSVVPGTLLADIYDKWGARLLEQNVRCFLQFRGKVNKGMRNTIKNEQEMFFAYNNGITATAESVELARNGDMMSITKVKNLQIVNGGQTTASIFTAREKGRVDISKVFVQMKLSIIDQEQAMEVVPKISEYANTQNKVNAADFFSNHPFHIRMEDFSRRIFAPSADGTFRQSKWFYERARGQYLDAQSPMTPAKKIKFKKEYPRHQLFTKTDLSKFENVWECIPHIVSKGAQFNFAQYAKLIGVRWDANSNQFNEHYYKCLIAKAIIFKQMEKIVSVQPWYDGGYRANIVAYSISKLSNMIHEKKKLIDFETIWLKQSLSEALYGALVEISGAVHEVIINTPEGMKNISEWAKKPFCWERTKEIVIPFPKDLEKELVSSSQVLSKEKDATELQKIDNDVMAQNRVVELGASFWIKAIDWCKSNRVGSPKDHEIMTVAASIPFKIPTGPQSIHLMTVLGKIEEEGCPFFKSL